MLCFHVLDGFFRAEVKTIAGEGLCCFAVLPLFRKHGGAADVEGSWWWWLGASPACLASGLMPELLEISSLERVYPFFDDCRFLFETFLSRGEEKCQL